MELLAAVTLLAVITISIASDCTICLRGRCLATSSFYDGKTKISNGRMVMDYKSNILYYYDDGIKAIYLDTNTMTPVPTNGNKGNYLGFDQDTGDLYYYKNGKEHSPIYKYQTGKGDTDTLVVSNPEASSPMLNMLVHNSTIYFNTHQPSGLDVASGLNTLKNSVIEKVAGLENITPNNIVFDKFGNMYIKSGHEIYRLKPNAREAVLFLSAKYLIGGDKNGEVYFFDPVKRFFYQVDPNTDELVKIGGYDASRDGRKRPNVKEFVFDKNGNLILKDKWSTLYYKEFPARCEFEYEESNSRTRITKLQ